MNLIKGQVMADNLKQLAGGEGSGNENEYAGRVLQ
jgi:hypothetical protein